MPWYGRATSLDSLKRFGTLIAAVLAALAIYPAAAAAALTVTIVDEDRAADASTWGRVTSSPAGIDCPTDCDQEFAPGERVTLTATGMSGYSLARWNVFPDDPVCGSATTCELTVAAAGDTSVEVEFHPAAQLSVVPRGAGTITISPTQGTRSALCDTDYQQDLYLSCVQRYVPGTPVTLTAVEDDGGTFLGWTDYACRNSSLSCTIRLTGDRFIGARFSPVRLRIESGMFGGVSLSSPRNGYCALLATSPLCEFTREAGGVVTLRREHGAAGQYWVGSCRGNSGGLLDAEICRLRMDGDEYVAAGRDNPNAIPPVRGMGLTVTIGGRGKVRGGVINSSQTLSCPPRCRISRATDYDRVRLEAVRRKGSRFVRWSGGSRLRKLVVELERVNRIRAIFASRRR
jgi:List-Bact-rpt repeat protein